MHSIHPYSVLVKPLMTEKSTLLLDKHQQYTFEILLKADKFDVKDAVEKLYDVKVVRVATLITRGKLKRRGNSVSQTAKTKKAIVTLAAGQKLDIFET